NLDQISIGNLSIAGRLTRNAPMLFNQDCGGTCVRAVPRRDIRRVLRLSVFSGVRLRNFSAGAATVSSGIDRATQVPAPTKVSKYPSASSCSYAFKTGMRETFSSAARARVDGILWPGGI